MAFLSAVRNTLKFKDTSVADLQFVPIAANVVIYVGSMVATDVNGRAVRGGDAAATQRVIGKAEVPYLPQPIGQNTSPNTKYDNTFVGNVAGGLTVAVRSGIFKFATGTAADQVTQALLNQDCYALDDQTVTPVPTAHVKAGRVFQVDTDGVWVAMGYYLP